jgi:hypothetical protein
MQSTRLIPIDGSETTIILHYRAFTVADALLSRRFSEIAFRGTRNARSASGSNKDTRTASRSQIRIAFYNPRQ